MSVMQSSWFHAYIHAAGENGKKRFVVVFVHTQYYHQRPPPSPPPAPQPPLAEKKKKSTVMSETADQAHSDSCINSHSSISGTHLHGTVRLCSSRRGGKSPHQTDNSESAVMIFPRCASYASYRECSRGQQRAVGPPFLLRIRFWLPTFVFCLTPFS